MKTLLLAAVLIPATSYAAISASAAEIAIAPAAITPRETPDISERQDSGGAQKSIEVALESARTDAEKVDALIQLGALFDEQQRYAPARQTYQRALPLVAASPDDLATTRLFVAMTYVNQKMWSEAADSWAQLLEKPASPQLKATYQLGLAQAFIELKQTDEAARQLADLRAQMAPTLADKAARPDERGFALVIIGRSYQTQNDLAAARQNFEAVAQIEEVSSELRVNALKSLAEIAEKQGRDADALNALGDARQLLSNEASRYFAEKDWETAATFYREALQTGAPDAVSELPIRWQLGNALREQGDIDGARAEFMRVTAIGSDASKPMANSLADVLVPFSYYYLAQGYVAQQKFDLARAALQSELALPDLQAPVRREAEELLASLANAG